MNTPYVKQYNDEGIVINPIVGSYVSKYPNRRKRHEKTPPFTGNGKQYPMVVHGKYRFKKVLQLVKNIKDGGVKKIYHYLAV